MATIVNCPSCGRALNLPEEALGSKVQCPTCATAFDATPTIPVNMTLEEDGQGPLGLRIPGVPPPPKPFRPVLVESSQGPAPVPGEEEEFERCPLCKRRVSSEHDLCPHCGTDLDVRAEADGRLRGPPRRDYEPHRGGLISALGVVSILFGVFAALALCAAPFAVAGLIGAGTGGAAWIMARDDLEQMDRNIMDPDGRRQTQTGQTNAIIGTIVSLLGILVGALHALVFLSAGL